MRNAGNRSGENSIGRRIAGVWNHLNKWLEMLDNRNFWWLGLFLLAGIFVPYAVLGEGSVFEIHDQLDETILTYVLNAKYLFTGTDIFPEMLGGVNVSGMQPSAVLFVLLYRIFPPLTSFVLQYLLVCASGYFGMYFCVRELTGSAFLSVLTAALFCMLPIQPIYGLSVLGVPLLLYAFLCLMQRKQKALSFFLILFFGVTTHLVLIGYVVLSFWGLAVLVMLCRRKHNAWLYGGFFTLTAVYILVNYRLFLELVLGNSSYLSHREELVNYASPVWKSIADAFLGNVQHASSLHKYLIIPVVILLLVEAFRYKKLSQELKKLYWMSVAIMGVLALTSVFYGVCRSAPVAAWKNSLTGFLRYFQMERYYWIAPALWYLEAALAFGLIWKERNRVPIAVKLALLGVVLLPTIEEIKVSSSFYANVNQLNNGSGVTGYITWEDYYGEAVMKQVDAAIGRDKSTYRVAHLGMSPCPALMYGFYTIDGYSNNYPLEYKHAFRRIIAKELEKSEAARLYFDEWGSRCYLFNGETGTLWMLSKGEEIQYSNLELDTEQMKALGCEYLFSAGEILNARELGLESMGYFDTEDSFWGIWLYRV